MEELLVIEVHEVAVRRDEHKAACYEACQEFHRRCAFRVVFDGFTMADARPRGNT